MVMLLVLLSQEPSINWPMIDGQSLEGLRCPQSASQSDEVLSTGWCVGL